MAEPTASEIKQRPVRELRAAAGRGMRVTLFGMCVSVALAAVKIAAGIVGNSYALIADGVESTLDILGAVVVLGSLRVAARPPNARFPYGYGKAEPLAGLWLSLALLAAALGIAIQSVREILAPQHLPAPFTLAVLVGVVLVKEVLFRRMAKTGSDIGSRAIETDAWHHRSDALTSVAAFVGISIALLAGPGYESADDWAALFACGVIAFNGVRLFRASLGDALDAAPDAHVEESIRRVTETVQGVLATEKCHVRRSGLGFFVDLHVIVNGNLTVLEGHNIAHEVKDALLSSGLGILDVVVHIEPGE